MKNISFLLLIFFFVNLATPASLRAATCNFDTAQQCGSLGGCPVGQKCEYNIQGQYYCAVDSTCPQSSTLCGSGSTVGNCGPSAGCRYGEMCSYNNIQGNSFCLPSNQCSTTPPNPTASPSPSLTPTPTTEVLPTPSTIEPCPNDGTIYPPNSVCYSKVKPKETERIGINLADSNKQLITYPISCIPGPTITYKETYTGENLTSYGAPVPRTVQVNTKLTNVTLGFLGPDSTTLATTNRDLLAQKYLFNALFDRPDTTIDAQRESFRTFWRMLNGTSQAQLKAYYLEKSNPNNVYYYVDKDKKQKKVVLSDLKKDLPYCLKEYGIKTNNLFINCWGKGLYNEQYLKLVAEKPLVAEAYDALLPFDFDNMRAYLSNGDMVSEENIPYLKAILTGLKGYRSDVLIPYYVPGFGYVRLPKTDVPGLIDYYTPEWAIRPLALYPQYEGILPGVQNDLQKIIINFISLLNTHCDQPNSTSSAPSPKTIPDITEISYTKVINTTVKAVDSTPDKCSCKPNDNYCSYRQCSDYSFSSEICLTKGCDFEKGEYVFELTGTATGRPITVFNNPYITSLTDLILGGKKLLSNASSFGLRQDIIDSINYISDKLISPVQPSFYKMLLPSFASDSASTASLIGAPSIENSATALVQNASVTISGGGLVYRENNLAQDTMHLLQNCWLVPSDQQVSSKCPSGSTACGITPNLPQSSNCSVDLNRGNPLNLPNNLLEAINSAGSAYHVPASLIIGVMYGEGAFNPGSKYFDYSFVEEHLKSCSLLPNCDPNAAVSHNIVDFYQDLWGNLKNAVNAVDPQRLPNSCNLLDGIFALAKDLHQGRGGSLSFSGKTCFGIALNSNVGPSNSCDWSSSDIETAIRVWEIGTGWDETKKSCLTKENSCYEGGSLNSQCPTGGDTCETLNNLYPNPSHNRCIWDTNNLY